MFRIAAIAAAVATASASNLRTAESTDLSLLFEEWRMEHGIEFESAQEYVNRKAIFAANHAKIIQHNASGAEWTMGHNKFSHMTADEFKAMLNGYIPSNDTTGRQEFDLDVPRILAAAPTSIDWSTSGAVTGVKDQGQCGSCWSFSTTGALEGAYFLKTGQLLSFSEQELVDCDTQDSGCNGGLMDYAFQYVKKSGLASESSYPYKGVDGTCQSSSKARALPAATVTGYTDITAGSETALLAAVATRPVSVAIEADQSAFQLYSGGVMTGTCGHNLDHGVLAVGYGVDNGVNYWKVKNSWGSGWGEKGYIRIQRGTGKCGIADAASYPNM